MGGVCERPGCSRPGAAAVAADARNLTVWIGDLETSDASVNTLCALHADNLAIPVGWVCRDVRDAPRLFAVRPTPVPSDPTPPPPRRKRAARRNAAVTSQRLDHTEQVAAPGADATAAEATAAGGSSGGSSASAEVTAAASPPAHLGDLHRGDAQLSEATAGLLRAGTTTPLLARAFRTARTARAAG